MTVYSYTARKLTNLVNVGSSSIFDSPRARGGGTAPARARRGALAPGVPEERRSAPAWRVHASVRPRRGGCVDRPSREGTPLKWGTSLDLPTYPRRESWTVWQRRQARGTTWIRLAS